MKIALALGSALLALAAVAPASAQTVLTFEGAGDLASVDDFYNGGTDSLGNAGPDYGINFSNNSLSLIDSTAGGSGNTGNDPSGVTTLIFLSGGAATMNVAAGFDTGFSFFYAAGLAGSVTVYDGLNATGNVLASLTLDPTNNPYYDWTAIGVSFAGIAHSVDFGGSANYVAFDNITLGSDTPGGGTVPEPATWALMIGGFGMVGGAMRRRHSVKVAYAA